MRKRDFVGHTLQSGLALIFALIAPCLAPAFAQATTNSNTGISWNNIIPAIGLNNSATIPNLTSSRGAPSGVSFQMLSPFKATDQNGSLSAQAFPANATRDSLVGDTDASSFKVTFPSDIFAISFTVYASRLGSTHNLQTRYTLIGATTTSGDLNPAGNINDVIYLSTQPDANNSVTFSIAPGPANNHPEHLAYLSAIRLATVSHNGGGPNLYFDFGPETSTTGSIPFLTLAPKSNSTALLRFDGADGIPCELQSSTDLSAWEHLQYLSLTNGSGELEIQLTPTHRFLRAIQ